MKQKMAVAVVHGIGNQAPEFAVELEATLQRICHKTCGEDVIIKPVYWAPAMQRKEDALWDRLTDGGPMSFKKIRRLAIDYVADALAYQPTGDDRKTYDDIHVIYAQTLRALAEEAGPKAPLCIVSHSLGTVITSNYIYDLQKPNLINCISAAFTDCISDLSVDRDDLVFIFPWCQINAFYFIIVNCPGYL